MYTIQHLELRSASARRLFVGRGCLLRVTTGRVWITLEQGSEDIWLLPGQEWRAPGAVQLWISAEPVARLQVLAPLPAPAMPAQWGAVRRWFKPAIEEVGPPVAAA